MQVEMKTWLPWSEVAGGTRLTIEQFRDGLRQSPRSAILKTCCRLSILFKFGPNANTIASKELSLFWAPKIFPPQYVPSVIAAINQGRPVFFQGQLRFLAAEAMRLECAPPDDGSFVSDTSIGPLLLGAAEMLYKKHEPDLQDELDQMTNLIADFLPIYEIDQLTDPIIAFVRFYIFLKRMPDRLPFNIRKLFDVPALFEREFGFPLKLYYEFVFAFTVHGINERNAVDGTTVPEGGLPISWFKRTILTDQQVSAMFDTVSCALADLPDTKPTLGYADFEFLRDHPYLRIEDRLYSVDYEFAVAKLESGVLWRIAKSLPNDTRLSYFSYWGEIFEEYIAWLFEEYADKAKNKFYRAPKLQDGNKQPLCDAVVRCGGTAVMIEAKVATCPAHVRYSGDYKKIRKFLEDRLVVGTNRKVGVSQLQVAFEHLASKPESALPECLRGVKTFIPVIITRDDVGSSWMTNAYLKRRFREGLARKAWKRFKIKPLISMSVSTLERLLGALATMSLTDILDDRMKTDPPLSRPFEAASHYTSRGTPINLHKHYEVVEAFTQEMIDGFGMVEEPTEA